MLIMAKVELAIPPPLIRQEGDRVPVNTLRPTPVATIELGEDEQLQTFLKQLLLFQRIRGPTDHAQYIIRVKNHPPIKQCYHPRNPAM